MHISEEQLRSILIEGNFLTEEQLAIVSKIAQEKGTALQELVVKKGLISDEHLGALIADYIDVPYVDLNKVAIDESILHILPLVMAQKHQAIVFKEKEKTIMVAMDDPDDLELIHSLTKKTGKRVEVYYSTAQGIQNALRLYQLGITEELKQLAEQMLSSNRIEVEESGIVQMVDLIFRYAYEARASDIHLEPSEKSTLVRYRIDGVLHDVGEIPEQFHNQVTMRIKVMANLRTDFHREAQDGKLIYSAPEEVDVRVSVVPITGGEKIVLRLLAEGAQQFSLDNLGLNQEQFSTVQDAARRPHGMLLATGPTGCGKTTTLYAMLKILNTRSINIATIEDPVEYEIEGANQIQVDAQTNLTFASGLRAIVRQDPDVIMVGEIRDEETAGIAVNSAMTGHLVLSTLHTNDAATTLPRLIDMKVEPFLIASTINLIVAQRLVRRICSKCVQSEVLSGAMLEEVKATFDVKRFIAGEGEVTELRFYKGSGCSVCRTTGYSGRIGIFEVMQVTDKIQRLIVAKADANRIRDAAREEGMRTMYEDGLDKALQGVTTIHEVMRVIRE